MCGFWFLRCDRMFDLDDGFFRARSQGAWGGESAIIALAFPYARVKGSDT